MLLRLFYIFSSIVFWAIPAGIWTNEILPGQQSLHWQRTTAFVVSHQTTRIIAVRGSTPALRIVYSYVYLTHHYQNDLVRFSEPNRGEKFEDGLTYPIGRSVLTYVNPERPEQAILEPGIQETSLDFFWFGILLALVTSGLSLRELNKLNRLKHLDF